MDIEEAKKKLKISQEETEALQHYTGFEHTRINLLCNMDPDIIESLSKDGWLMLKNKEELEEYITKFNNIYSAMYKNYKSGYRPTRLVRGTGNEDVLRMRGTVNQFISTTTSMEVAKTFTHYGDAAIIYLDLEDGVPAIDMQKYQSENSRNEQEVLLSPFCRVIENKESSNWDGYTFYDVKLAKPELKEKSQNDIDSLKNKVINGFEHNSKLIEEYIDLKDKIELVSERLQIATATGADKEDITFLEDDLFEKREKFFEITNNINDYKNSLRGLLEGMCRQKEIEIDKAQHVIDENTKKEQEETKKRINEEIRVSQIGELNGHIDRAVKDSNGIGDSLDAIYEELLRKDSISRQMCESLGISYKSRSEIGEIGKKIEGIKEVLSGCIENVQEERLDDKNTEVTTQDAIIKDNSVSEYDSSIIQAQRLIQSIDSYAEEYGDEEEHNIKEEVYKKAMELIKEAKTQKLEAQKDEIANRKVGLFGRIFGKEKLRQAELKNVELKIEAEQVKKTNTRFNDFSIRNTLATIHNAKDELEGANSEKLTAFYNAIKENFGTESGKFKDEEIAKIASDMTKSNLPMVIDPKEKTKAKTQRLQEENARLEVANKEAKEMESNDDLEERESSATDMLRSLVVVRECLESNPYSRESRKEIQKEKERKQEEQDRIRKDLESQFK